MFIFSCFLKVHLEWWLPSAFAGELKVENVITCERNITYCWNTTSPPYSSLTTVNNFSMCSLKFKKTCSVMTFTESDSKFVLLSSRSATGLYGIIHSKQNSSIYLTLCQFMAKVRFKLRASWFIVHLLSHNTKIKQEWRKLFWYPKANNIQVFW